MNDNLDELRLKISEMDIDQTERTDSEIYADAEADWMGILASLWVAIGKPVDPERLRIYANALKDIPLGLLELAIDRVLRQQTWNVVPLPGVISAAVERELEAVNATTIADWLEIQWRIVMCHSRCFVQVNQNSA